MIKRQPRLIKEQVIKNCVKLGLITRARAEEMIQALPTYRPRKKYPRPVILKVR